MPPKGHKSVTMSEELVAELDAYAEATGARSRAEAIRSLLEDSGSAVSARIVDIDSTVVDRLAEETAESMEGRMR